MSLIKDSEYYLIITIDGFAYTRTLRYDRRADYGPTTGRPIWDMDTDIWVKITGLCDAANPEVFDNNAVVTMTLYNDNDDPVSGAEDLPLDYIEDSNGDYEGIIPYDIIDEGGS